MSFSDMISSARGPGVIGTFMALAVMAIFVMFFVFAFDDRFQGGGKSIESIIVQQAQELEGYKLEIGEGQKKLDEVPALDSKAKEMARLKTQNNTQRENIVTLSQKIEISKAEIVRMNEALAGYKDQYRSYVRNKAKGESLEILETQGGVIYKNVSIREVTAIGIQIRHEGGQKRIPFEELPESMKDFYQFDANQKAVLVAQEQAAWNEHEAAVMSAEDLAGAEKSKFTEKEAGLLKEKIMRNVALRQGQIALIRQEIGDLEQALSRAESQASAARAAGRPHMDKSSAIRRDIQSKQQRVSLMQAEINEMNSGIR